MNAKMSELKNCFEKAGFTDVKTVLGSGNVLFSARTSSEATLERQIEKTMKTHLDRVFQTIVRPVDAIQEILASDPFEAFRLKSASKRIVTFLRAKPSVKIKLPVVLEGARILKVEGREIYTTYVPSPKGPVFMTLIEKTFGKEVTTRTWETLKKLVR